MTSAIRAQEAKSTHQILKKIKTKPHIFISQIAGLEKSITKRNIFK